MQRYKLVKPSYIKMLSRDFNVGVIIEFSLPNFKVVLDRINKNFEKIEITEK